MSSRDAARAVPRTKGLSVALLGTDGSGKSTLARIVADAIPAGARVIYLGLWGKSAPVARVGPPGVDLIRRLAYAWRRWLAGRWDRARGRLVIFDRYPFDALAGVDDATSLLERIYLTVLGRSCPAPDLVILLDTPGAVAYARKGEHDVAKLERDRQRLLRLRDRLRGVEVVVVDADRPMIEVSADVIAAIDRRLEGD